MMARLLVFSSLVAEALAEHDGTTLLQMKKAANLQDSDVTLNDTEGFAGSWVGCFTDDGQRDLDHGPGDKTGHKHTTHECMKKCQAGGFRYMGLQYYGQCWCGNGYRTQAKYQKCADSQCGGPCRGERDGRCGTAWHNAIYQIPQLPPHVGSYVGCFVDDGARDLGVFKGHSGGNTRQCRRKCKGYVYMGMQYNGECWCGNTYSSEPKYAKRSNGECGKPCNGERTGLCGSSWRNAIYQIGNPRPHVGKYIGCFVDDGARDLKTFKGHSGHTTEICKQKCHGFAYMGLQYSGECWCGNAFSTQGKYAKRNDQECGAPCRGERDGKCGASWRNAVYQIGTPPAPPPPAYAAPTPAPVYVAPPQPYR